MDLDGLADTAELVVRFDVKLYGQHPADGMSVYWHEQNRQWLVNLPGYVGGVARAELLRKFADGALATLEQGIGESDSTMFIDDHRSVQALTGVDEDGPYLVLWVWYDGRHDFLGVGAAGEPLYRQATATDCIEFGTESADLADLKGQFWQLLRRLDTVGPSTSAAPRSANVVASFAKRVNDPSQARLEIARRADDWLVTLHPHLTRPSTDDAIRALADATEQVLDERGGERLVTLLTEEGYHLDVTVTPEAEAFTVTATVRSPGQNQTLDARFGPIGEAQLRDLVKALR